MTNSIKEAYDSLKRSGDLIEMFPMLEGIWEEDKMMFIQMYELNSDIFEN